ncbi:hypothetical protein [Reichenbachiella sp.]|uniref:hypothetical protein n=1 Tax=Reichenbachiella sp. TaxID=2184521 RepID=UPI003BAE44CA
MLTKFGVLVATIWVVGLTEIVAQKQDSTVAKDFNKWDFRISPFFWYIGIEGQVNAPPKPSNLPEIQPIIDIDLNFKDISHSIKFALMLSGDYRGDWLVSKFNFMSLVLDTDAVTPREILLRDVNLKFHYFSGDLAFGYLFLDRKKLDMEAFVGVKVASIKARVKGTFLVFPVEGERHTIWFDPMIAYRVRYFPIRRLELMGYVDYGVRFWKHQTYQLNSEAVFHFSKLFYMSLGYRTWGAKADIEDVAYSGRLKGWISRIGFQF